MKRKLLLTAIALTMCIGLLWAQQPQRADSYDVMLNGSRIQLQMDFAKFKSGIDAQNVGEASSNPEWIIVQFSTIPSEQEKVLLKQQGLEVLDYVNGNAFYASMSPGFNNTNLNLRAAGKIDPEIKISQQLQADEVPDYAAEGLMVKVFIRYYKNVDQTLVTADMSRINIRNMSNNKQLCFIKGAVLKSDLDKIASFSWVQGIDMTPPPPVLENYHGRTLHRANYLQSTVPGLGYGLTGKGVKLGIWDGDVENHRDFNGRITVHEAEDHSSSHGTHTAGTIASAGLLNPLALGMAPDINMFSWNFSAGSNGLYTFEERLISLEEDDIEITSNSWGWTISSCNTRSYDAEDYYEDLIASYYPYFLYVFSAGNSQSACPGGFNTTSKNMKNSLMVAAVDWSEGIASFSSFGPAYDGRLIPNISGDGVSVYSNAFNNSYVGMGGTSMSTPGVAGTMALLYQRYKEQHGGQLPLSSLMRGLACNTARDLGNPGPDYKFGYGAIDGARAVEVLDKNQYFIGKVNNGEQYTQDITIPAGAVGLRVMLSWTDASSPSTIGGSTKALINDLDLSVTKGGVTTRPWILNPANPAAPAIRGYDRLNNLEQVTIDNLTPGTYTITVNGLNVPTGSQVFAVTYDIIMPSLNLIYPIGDEKLIAGFSDIIRWNYVGDNAPITLEVSTDGGATYTTVANNIPSKTTCYLYTVPTTPSKEVKFRISNGTFVSTTKGLVTFMAQPEGLTVGKAQCDGTGPFTLQWDAISNAKYRVLKLNGQTYEVLADNVATNSYNITGIAQDNNNWYAVQAIDLTTGAIGERSEAITVNPATVVASLPFSEDFDSEKADNFYFTTSGNAVAGKADVRYVLDDGRFGAILQGAANTASWNATGINSTTCWTNNPDFITSANICSIDATAMAGKSMVLKFDYRLKADAANQTFFRVKVNGNVLTNTEGVSVYGGALAENRADYTTVYYDLSPYAGQNNLRVTFEAVCKGEYEVAINTRGDYVYNNSSLDEGDFVAIDNVEIKESTTPDLALEELDLGTGYTNAEVITVIVKNLSGHSIYNIPVSYQVNGGAAINEVIPGPIAPFKSVSYSFTQTADFSTLGETYVVKASVKLASDPILDNNSLTETIANNGSDILIGVDLESGYVYTNNVFCGATVTDPQGRYKNYENNLDVINGFAPTASPARVLKLSFEDFALENGSDYLLVYRGFSVSAADLVGIYTGNTIPKSIVSTGSNGGFTFRFITDGDGTDRGFVAKLECLTTDVGVTAISAPTSGGGLTATESVRATVRNYGAAAVTNVPISLYLDNGLIITETIPNIPARSGVNYTFSATLNLSAIQAYEVKVETALGTDENADNNSFTKVVSNGAVASDVGVSSIAAIVPQRNKTFITATFKNFGNSVLTNIPVSYQINGEGTPVTETIPGPLAIGASVLYTFTTKADLAAHGTHNVDVYTQLAGDVDNTNDRATTQFASYAKSPTNMVGQFDGYLGSVVAPATPATNLSGSYTVECWVNPQQPLGFGRIIDKTYLSIFYQLEYATSVYPANSYVIAVNTSSLASFTYYYPGAVKPGKWQHIALSVNAGVYSFYVDGVLQTPSLYSGTVGNITGNATQPLNIGNNAALNRGFKGGIDELRIWNSARTQAQITADMVTDFAADTPGLMAYYKFAESGGRYIFDYSANDNTATASGGYAWGKPGNLLTDVGALEANGPASFNPATKTYSIPVNPGTPLNIITTTFNAVEKSDVKISGVNQVSGVSTNDFTGGQLTYDVEGVGFNTGINQQYKIEVVGLSGDCDLNSFAFEVADNPELSSDITLTKVGSKFSKQLTEVDLNSLKASFSVSPGAKLYINGVEIANHLTPIDYSNELIAKVVAENGTSSKLYTIKVESRFSGADLLSFSIMNEQIGTSVINSSAKTIDVWVKNASNRAMLTPLFTLSPKATLYVGSRMLTSGASNVDFSNPTVVTVHSEDEQTLVNWIVTVTKDAVKPVITLVGLPSVTVAHGSTYVDAGATASDNVDGDVTTKMVVTGSVNTSVLGTYTIRYNVTDAAGNVANEVIRTVIVADQTKPVISLVGLPLISLVKGSVYVDAGATAVDNVDGNITASIVVTGSVNTSVYGTYIIRYNIADAAGNTAEEVTRTVVITDHAKPVITLLGSPSVTIAHGSTYVDAGATALDDIDGDITSNIVVVNPVDTDVIGVYTITYNVTDTDGNVANEVTRTVTVTDQTKPVITLLGDSEVTIFIGAIYSDAGATATDNVHGDITASIVVANSVNSFVEGTYTVRYNVSDAAGNAADEVVRTVIVKKVLSQLTAVEKLLVNGNEHDMTKPYVMDCSAANLISVEVVNSGTLSNIVATTGTVAQQGDRTFTLTLNTPAVATVSFTVTSESGTATEVHQLVVEKRIAFSDIVIQKWNNTLMINTKALREMGYSNVSDIKWYKDGVQIGTGNAYSAGQTVTHLLSFSSMYSVQFTANGVTYSSCSQQPVQQKMSVLAYPNPVSRGGEVTLSLEGMNVKSEKVVVNMYDMMGVRKSTQRVSSDKSSVTVPTMEGIYILELRSNDEVVQTMKIIVQ